MIDQKSCFSRMILTRAPGRKLLLVQKVRWKHREVKQAAAGHTAGRCRAGATSSGSQPMP